MKHIISSLAFLVGGAMLSTAAAATITDIAQINNSTAYLINRETGNSANGAGFMQAIEGQTIVNTNTSAKTDRTSPLVHWAIHYSDREKAYFLYNLGAEKFVGGNSKNLAELTSTAVDCVPIYFSNVRRWMFDCGGYFIGLNPDYAGMPLFADAVNSISSRSYGGYFTISTVDDVVISDEQNAAIEAKIAEGRVAKLDEYRKFIESTAKKVGSSGGTDRYIGEYDYEALEYALNNDARYTLAQIEEIYQETLTSRYPKANRYYRVHNFQRPGNHATNFLSTLADGTVVSRQLKAPSFGTAADGFTDDLCLVRLQSVNGDPSRVKIQMPATMQFLTLAANNGRPGLTSSIDDAYVYELAPVSPTARNFRFYAASSNAHLTTSPSESGTNFGVVKGYTPNENYNRWFFEEVKSIAIPVDANGYATVCLPCGVSLPEGVKAYTVTDFSNGKAYVEELSSPIHLSTPWILKAEAGASSIELPVVDNFNYAYSAMTGNMTAVSEAPGRYVPTFSADGISFTYAEAGQQALPGSCYLASENIGAVETVMGGNPNAGIEEITVDQAAARELFDMLGRPVKDGNLNPGIYINAATKKAVRIK